MCAPEIESRKCHHLFKKGFNPQGTVYGALLGKKNQPGPNLENFSLLQNSAFADTRLSASHAGEVVIYYFPVISFRAFDFAVYSKH